MNSNMFKNKILDKLFAYKSRTHTHTHTHQSIGRVARVFANGPGDWGLIPGRVTPKNQKWYFMPPCFRLSIIR